MAPKNTPPLGYRFRPTDHEVFTFLGKLVNRNQLPSYYPIVERTLFGDKPPWNVLNGDDPWEHITPEGNNNDSSEKKILFVFTKLVSLGKSRAVRSSACGTWDGKSALNKIKNKNRVVIGHKKYYTFKPKKNGLEETKTYGKWTMHEYSFPNDKSGFVLCKITVDGGTRVSVDDGLCGKRKLPSTTLDDDDGGSRKVCKGSGSSSGQEIVLKELDECQQVYDVTCQLLADYNRNLMLQETVTEELEECLEVLDVSCPLLAVSNHEDPSIKNGQEILNYSEEMLGQQIIQDYNGLENSPFATGYGCSFPIMQQPECQQQVKEILVGSTHDDIVKESHSATTSVGYSMTPTWCAGSSSSSTSIDQLQERREEPVFPSDCIPEMCGGSESEPGRISVTAELGETGTAIDDLDPWACIDLEDDLTFQIPSDMDDWEIPSCPGGMQGLLVNDNYGLDELLFETRSNLDEAENRFLLHYQAAKY